jgi:hypothetical protein
MPKSLGDPAMPHCACGAELTSCSQTVCSTCQTLADLDAKLEGNR